jgi:hypothetical protein
MMKRTIWISMLAAIMVLPACKRKGTEATAESVPVDTAPMPVVAAPVQTAPAAPKVAMAESKPASHASHAKKHSSHTTHHKSHSKKTAAGDDPTYTSPTPNPRR